MDVFRDMKLAAVQASSLSLSLLSSSSSLLGEPGTVRRGEA